MEQLKTYYPAKLVEVELSQEIMDFEDLDDYRYLNILARLHDEPLGLIRLSIIDGRCSADQIKHGIAKSLNWPVLKHLIEDGLAEPLNGTTLDISSLFGTSHPVWDEPLPAVSVIVCTRNRPDDLQRCLKSLEEAPYPDCEIIVVDNAPSDERTKEMIDNHFPGMRYVREPRPGLDWARNRGIAEACGEIIAYADDDVLVDRNWILAIGKAFVENPNIMGLAGLVLPSELETPAQVLFEQRGGFSRGFEQKWYQIDPAQSGNASLFLGTGNIGTGANMAFRRSLFTDIGLFDPALDAGTVSENCGDLDIFYRTLHAGHAILYEPQALVFHRHRREMEQFADQSKKYGIGLAAYHGKCIMEYGKVRLRFAAFHFWWLWEWYFKQLVRSYTRPTRYPRELLWSEFRGYILGITRYRKAKKLAEKISREHEVGVYQEHILGGNPRLEQGTAH